MEKTRNYLHYLSVSTLMRIRHCIKIGYTIDDISEHFNVTRESARKLYIRYKGDEYNRPRLGRKDEPYYEGENTNAPNYTLDDLSESELRIAKQNINPGKLWTWEE
jgi:hypothetical protein